MLRACGSDLREYESISIEPIRILRVEVHKFVEKNVGNGRHAHGGAGMPGVGFERSIDLSTVRGTISSYCILLPCVREIVEDSSSSVMVGAAIVGVTYREQTDRIDRQLICLGVAHDGGNQI